MKKRVKDIVSGLLLLGLAVALLPSVGRALLLLFERGQGSVGFAGLLSALALVVASGVAAVGVVLGRSWGRWSGRGVGLYWAFFSGGVIATRGAARLTDVALLAAGGLLIIALSPRAEDVSERPTAGERVRLLFGGWAIAFNVALLPALLGASTSTNAGELVLAQHLFGAGVVLSVLMITIGVIVLPWTRIVGAGLCLAGGSISLLLFFGAIGARAPECRALVLLYPALALAALTLAIRGIPILKRR